MIKIAPSMLSADFTKLGEELDILWKEGIEYLHVDVMDGSFVPSISFGMPVIKSIRKRSKLIFDVHLMIDEPIRYIEDFRNAGADFITVHSESVKHLDRTLNAIKDSGAKVGVAICPATPLCQIEEILHLVDMVLIMTVNPGFGGQSMIPYCLDKVRALSQIKQNKGLDFIIEVDGGINDSTIDEAVKSGAELLVMGSAIFGDKTRENTKYYQEKIKKYL